MRKAAQASVNAVQEVHMHRTLGETRQAVDRSKDIAGLLILGSAQRGAQLDAFVT
jgi:hypothetical protein